MMLYLLWKLIRLIILKPLFILLHRFNKHYIKLKSVKYHDGRDIYVMNTDYDCENIAIMTEICNHTEIAELYNIYDTINRALLRCECLGFIQNPIYGNPLNVRCALEELGYDVEKIHPNEIEDNDTVILLMHWYTSGIKHLLYQHWIGHIKGDNWNFGDGLTGHFLSKVQLERYWKCRLYATCYRIKPKSY